MSTFAILFIIVAGIIIYMVANTRKSPNPDFLKASKELKRKYDIQKPQMYTMSLVGWQFEGRKSHLQKTRQNDSLIFMPIKDNKHDPLAVGVFNLYGNQIGWVKRDAGGSKTIGEQLHADEIELYGTFAGYKDNWPYIEIGILHK